MTSKLKSFLMGKICTFAKCTISSQRCTGNDYYNFG